MTLEPRPDSNPGLPKNRAQTEVPADSPVAARSPILNAFSNLQAFRAAQVRAPEVSQVETLWKQAEGARAAGNEAQEFNICRTVMRSVIPESPKDNVFFAEAACRAADILLIQRKVGDARALLGELDERAELLPVPFRARALLLNAASRHLAGEVTDSEIDRLRFRDILLSTPDSGWKELLKSSDEGVNTLIRLPCQDLSIKILGDIIEGLEQRRENLYPQLYFTYLLAQANLLVGQESPDQSFERIRACQNAMESTFFADDRDAVTLHEQMAQVLAEIGMVSEALKERSEAIKMADVYGDTERSLSNRLGKMRLQNMLGYDQAANEEFAFVRNALVELLPRWFFVEVKLPEAHSTPVLERVLPDPVDREEFRIFAKLYSDLLIARMTQTIGDKDRFAESMNTASQISRIGRLLGEEHNSRPGLTDLLVARVSASVYARESSTPEELRALEEAARELRAGTPRFCQANYLLAIQKHRDGYVTEAAEHFELCEEIFQKQNSYHRTLPMLQLLTLKGNYLIDTGDLVATTEVLEQALALREEFNLVLCKQGRVNLELLVYCHRTLENDEQALRYNGQLKEVQDYLETVARKS